MAEPSDDTPRVTLEAWLATDVGMVREHNEDSAHSEPDRGFFIVADGMGGHAAGEVASAMAVASVKEALLASEPEITAFTKEPTDPGRRALVQLLQNAVLSAHRAVFGRGQAEPDKAGMGTTLDVVLVAGPEAFVAHVGDSRTYLVRDGRTSQITTDHTVAEVLVIEGKLTIEEAQVSPLRTILVNAIGVSEDVGVEMAHVTLKKNDRILICSDGLHDYFPAEDEVAEKLSEDKPGDALTEMVELAKTRGGHDNITGIAVHITEVVEAPIPVETAREGTEPVESANPFADEPTETTYVASPAGLAPRLGTAPPMPAPNANPRATVPMRIVNDEALGDTLPPRSRKPSASEDGGDTEPSRRGDRPPEARAEVKPVVEDTTEPKTERKEKKKKSGDKKAKSADKPAPLPRAASPRPDVDEGVEGPTEPSREHEAVSADSGRVRSPEN